MGTFLFFRNCQGAWKNRNVPIFRAQRFPKSGRLDRLEQIDIWRLIWYF